MEKKVIISAVVVIVVIFGAYLFLSTGEGVDSELKETFEQQVKLCLQGGNEDYNSLMAIKTGDIGYCAGLENQDFCVANVMGDLGICDSLEDPQEVRSCRAHIAMDSSLCDADNYYCLAYTTGNVEYCTSLEENEMEECVAQTTLDADYHVSKDKKNQCKDEGYLMMKTATGDSSYCSRISDTELKERCLG